MRSTWMKAATGHGHERLQPSKKDGQADQSTCPACFECTAWMDAHLVGLLAQAHEEIVWLDITVDKAA
jgi:hypothetical protein